jgi:hypothetical protein
MAVVAAQYVREQLATAAVPTKPIVEQCLSELREMFGKDEEETEEK